jgi:hypothetical protein
MAKAKAKGAAPTKVETHRAENLMYIPTAYKNVQPSTTEKVKKLSTEDLVKLYKEFSTIQESATDVKDLKSGISWFKNLDLSNIKRLRDRADISKDELRSLAHKSVAKLGKDEDISGLDNWGARQAINLAMRQKGLRQGGYRYENGGTGLNEAQLAARQSKAQYDAEQNAIREAQIQDQRMSFQGPISGYGGSQSVGGPVGNIMESANTVQPQIQQPPPVSTPVVTQQPNLLMGSESAQTMPFIQREGGVRQYEEGGAPTSMYGSNVIPGSMGSTSSIVFQETGDERLKSEEKELLRLEADKTWMNEAVERRTKQKKFDATMSMGVQGVKTSFDQWGKEKGFKNWAEYLKDRAAKKALEETGTEVVETAATDVAGAAVKGAGEEVVKAGTEELVETGAGEVIKGAGTEVVEAGAGEVIKGAGTEVVKGAGTEVIKGAGTEVIKGAGTEVVKGAGTELVKAGGEELVKGAGKELVKTAGTELVKETGKEAGKSLLKSMATSTANISPYAAAANVIGKGISMGADDQDATTWTAGEASGDVLGSMGEYAGYGATLGTIIPGIGNVVGAAAGAIVGAVKGVTEGLINRRKAREEEKEHKLEVEVQQGAKDVEFFRRKRYSGFDFGQDIEANPTVRRSELGGYRFGGRPSRLQTIKRYNLA